jgi:hypothetical protein
VHEKEDKARKNRRKNTYNIQIHKGDATNLRAVG